MINANGDKYPRPKQAKKATGVESTIVRVVQKTKVSIPLKITVKLPPSSPIRLPTNNPNKSAKIDRI